jgi:hypothetical protein
MSTDEVSRGSVSQAHARVPWSAGTEPPKTKAPPDATDCHHHLYSARFRIDPGSALRPGDASLADYLRHR